MLSRITKLLSRGVQLFWWWNRFTKTVPRNMTQTNVVMLFDERGVVPTMILTTTAPFSCLGHCVLWSLYTSGRDEPNCIWNYFNGQLFCIVFEILLFHFFQVQIQKSSYFFHFSTTNTRPQEVKKNKKKITIQIQQGKIAKTWVFGPILTKISPFFPNFGHFLFFHFGLFGYKYNVLVSPGKPQLKNTNTRTKKK
jgi:hypothetical protein